MREVSRQIQQYRERRSKWEWGGVLAKGKAAPDTSVHLFVLFFIFWGKKQKQRVAGFPNTVLLSAPLSALSQRNGWANNERARETAQERERERGGGSGWEAVFNKGRGEERLELGEGTEKRKQARIKAFGNSTQVLSEWWGGQQKKRGPWS